MESAGSRGVGLVVLQVLNPYSVLVVGVCVTACAQGLAVWFLLDFVVSLLFGVSFLLTPQLLLSLQTAIKVDALSLHMARALGCMLLSSSFYSYYSYVSRLDVETEALAQSRVIANCALILAMVYAQVHYAEFTIEHIQFGIVGCVAWTLPWAYVLASRRTTRKTCTAGFDFFILVDFFATSSCGTAWFAFPQWLLRRLITSPPNGVSVHLARAFGAMLIGSSFLSYASTHFVSSDMKKTVLASRIVGSLPLLALVVLAQLRGPFSTLHIFIGVAGAGFWTANAVVGFLILSYLEAMNATSDNPLLHSSQLDDPTQPSRTHTSSSLSSYALQESAHAHYR